VEKSIRFVEKSIRFGERSRRFVKEKNQENTRMESLNRSGKHVFPSERQKLADRFNLEVYDAIAIGE
jgi:hypothetical protein